MYWGFAPNPTKGAFSRKSTFGILKKLLKWIGNPWLTEVLPES
jgi:hypothetical protein